MQVVAAGRIGATWQCLAARDHCAILPQLPGLGAGLGGFVGRGFGAGGQVAKLVYPWVAYLGLGIECRQGEQPCTNQLVQRCAFGG